MPRRTAGGYTLVEFTLVVGLMAFMVTQAIPVLIERAADQRLRAAAEDVRMLAAAAAGYRTDPGQITEPNRGHYGEWPAQGATDTAATAHADLVAYLGHFRSNAAGDGFLSALGRPITVDPRQPADGPLRIDLDFGDPAHAERFAFLAGPTACVPGQAGCPAGCDGSALTPPESRACYFVPPPAQEFIHDHFALLDGSRPFVLDGAAQLEVRNAPPPALPLVSIDRNGDIVAQGDLNAAGAATIGSGLIVNAGDVRVLDGSLVAGLVFANQVDATEVRICTPGCQLPGSTSLCCPRPSLPPGQWCLSPQPASC